MAFVEHTLSSAVQTSSFGNSASCLWKTKKLPENEHVSWTAPPRRPVSHRMWILSGQACPRAGRRAGPQVLPDATPVLPLLAPGRRGSLLVLPPGRAVDASGGVCVQRGRVDRPRTGRPTDGRPTAA